MKKAGEKESRKRERAEKRQKKEEDAKDDHTEFDILNWWKLKAFKYYILFCMVRDILVIFVSTISFEFAFSTG